MGEDRPEQSQPLDRDTDSESGDYSYDMSHEVPAEPGHRAMEAGRHPGHTGAEIPPPDPEEGDYSYDLAHEVPPPKR